MRQLVPTFLLGITLIFSAFAKEGTSWQLTNIEDAKTYDGKKINFKNIQSSVVILNFWASWCVPCLKELPSLVELQKKYQEDKLKVITVNSDEIDQIKNIKRILQKYHLNFDIIADKGELVKKFDVAALPFSVIFVKGKYLKSLRGEENFLNLKIDEMIKGQ